MSIQYVPFQGSGSSVLPPNQKMSPGHFLVSPNGRFRLELWGDGNLVIKDNGVVAWVADAKQPYSSTLQRKGGTVITFLVSNGGFLYDGPGRRTWIARSTESTDKSFWYNNYLAIQDDGNLVIYDNRSGGLRWARFGFVPGRIGKPKLVNVNDPHTNILKKWTWEF
ncbi:hypothetical protein [Pseudomonas sp. NA-150]|uniref:hypothetical protein n=1 Tax=Pseudomonas sp. NA-150 TaxID=3367525 RepID=UPI0037C83A27